MMLSNLTPSEVDPKCITENVKIVPAGPLMFLLCAASR